MQRIMHIVGARPNFMKAAPVVQASHQLGDEPVLVHTGQHYDAEMSDIFFEQLGLPRPTSIWVSDLAATRSRLPP